MKSIFIYYTVPQQHEAEFLQIATEFLTDLRKISGVQGELLKRVNTDKDNAQQTWMEIYREVNQPESFLQTLNILLPQSTLPALISMRHVEIFESVSAVHASV